MRIDKNTIYYLPTKKHEEDFLKKAEEQGFEWISGSKPTSKSCFHMFGERYCIFIGDDKNMTCGSRRNDNKAIEWKVGFTKSDMQEGQAFKTRNEKIRIWNEGQHAKDYYDNLMWLTKGCSEFDVIEVYQFPPTPIWKREESKKYRVKNELTQGQAEKLGLDLCEVIE